MSFVHDHEYLDASSKFHIIFHLHGESEKIKLDLVPNNNVISELRSVHHLGSDGDVQRIEVVKRQDHLVFKGASFVYDEDSDNWRAAGWARVTVLRTGKQPLFEGTSRIDGDNYHILTNANYMRTRNLEDPIAEASLSPYLIAWKDPKVSASNIPAKRDATPDLTCGFSAVDQLSLISPTHIGRYLHGRQSSNVPFDPTGVIGSTEGCPTSRRIARIGIATDCTYTAEFDSEEEVRSNIISQINTASQVYEDAFNITLAIQNLTISAASCPSDPGSSGWNVPCTDDVNLSDRLGLFSQWRGRFNDGNALWTLMTACRSGSTVGIAWTGSLCEQGSQGRRQGRNVASANVVARTNAEWQVIAHEIGHVFGASHDCTADTCSGNTAEDCCPLSGSSCDAQGNYLMNPAVSQGADTFSPCSVGTICTAMGRNMVDASCLVNEGDVTSITDSQCGNGIVEPGEECDCGDEQSCRGNSCCDGATCRYVDGAVCDPSSDGCCTSQCSLAPSGQVCSESTGVCDPTGTCDGLTATCGRDFSSLDGTSCGNGRQCDSGTCTRLSRNNPYGSNDDSNWLDNNRTWIIVVPSVVGGILVIGVIICCVSSHRRRRQRNAKLETVTQGQPPRAMNVRYA